MAEREGISLSIGAKIGVIRRIKFSPMAVIENAMRAEPSGSSRKS
jgi:hypothetical protein